MEIKKKLVVERTLEKLSFVMWDRYFGDEKCMTFFGWIKREDTHDDFVVLDFFDKEISYATSSSKFSELIAEILNQVHSSCKRIENFTNIRNVIRLDGKKTK